MIRRILPLATICMATLLFTGLAKAYYPMNCFAEYAARDFADADAIVIARVIKFERKIEDRKEKRGEIERVLKYIDYDATLKVGKVIKGELKIGDEFLMYEGGCLQREEDNAEVTWIGQCNTHPRAGFQVDGVYLLFINKSAINCWRPRSCHFSVHRLELAVDEKTNARTTMVRESLGMKGDVKPAVALDAFLEAKKKEADETAKVSPPKVEEKR
jgi:hypothetical protein